MVYWHQDKMLKQPQLLQKLRCQYLLQPTHGKLNIVEGSYDEYDKNEKGYNFSVIKILDRYYAIMTNNFKNGNETETKTFYIGDVKAIFSSTQEINNYAGWYFMADKSKQPVTFSYNIIGNYINFSDFTVPYYKK